MLGLALLGAEELICRNEGKDSFLVAAQDDMARRFLVPAWLGVRAVDVHLHPILCLAA